MGGRGQNYTISNRLRNYKNAILPRNKFKNYLLNPSKDKDKAKFFADLGYNMKNYQRLQEDIRKKLSTNKALYYGKDEYGNERYQVNMSLGINKSMVVATAWAIKQGSKEPQLITVHPNNKRYFRRDNQ